MPISEQDVETVVAAYRANKKVFEFFLESVRSAFASDLTLNSGVPAPVHSLRARLKDDGHLAEKIKRKDVEGVVVTSDNLFSKITDLAGVRVLHLHQSQFGRIHEFISNQVRRRIWRLMEKPVAYTWDPESKEYFKSFKLRTEVKPSYYTSVHYVVAPANREQPAICEVQVRTLFEEVWGEIDHSINYPVKTTNVANVEQLRVLSKLVSTGSRLADSIFKIHDGP